MFTHNLKIAFRNMRKYKNQTLISVIGLAVGFTCFALATLWIRYEMSFDNFHKNAKNMYVVYTPLTNQVGLSYSRASRRALAAHLKETFPEIANATQIDRRSASTITVNGVEYPSVSIISVDSDFFEMFDVRILEGSQEFLIPGSGKIAVTREKAAQLFGNEDPIGKTIIANNNELTISTIVTGMSRQSNYSFDFIEPFPHFGTMNLWNATIGNVIIKLHPATNVEAFEKKLYEYEIEESNNYHRNMIIMPITKLRYAGFDIVREVKFQHILIFALLGLLVVLCSLFNYLMLFVSRFRIRQKELALRMVCGASGISLMVMLSVEFLLAMLFAVVLGFLLTQLVYQPFLVLSEIKMDLPAIYGESLIYIGGVILVSLLVFWLILFILRRRSLNATIRQGKKNMFRKISVIAQLVISIGFAFCAIVILKQMYHLHNSADLGFAFKNRGAIIVVDEIEMSGGVTRRLEGGTGSEVVSRLKQIPEIIEVVDAVGIPSILPSRFRRTMDVSLWDDKPDNVESVRLEVMQVSPAVIDFYEFRLVAGEMLTDYDPESMVLLNEKAVKAFGWYDPIGKQFDNGRFTVKGVIKHVYNFAPTIEPNPVVYRRILPGSPDEIIAFFFIDTDQGRKRVMNRNVLFKYHEGTWNSLQKRITAINEEFGVNYTVFNATEEYEKYLKSERALLTLLSFVSLICILICVFGFVSLVSLTCEERRKEIAIRKINGATASDILAMFAKEYFLLLIIGAVIAFTTGYYIMQQWLEHYVLRTNIPVWIYLGIIFALTLVIVLCVGWQVYRASVENPADVVKGE